MANNPQDPKEQKDLAAGSAAARDHGREKLEQDATETERRAEARRVGEGDGSSHPATSHPKVHRKDEEEGPEEDLPVESVVEDEP